jgi:autophagy-related protein 9
MMLSRVFGRGSIYETLDQDDRREDPGYQLYNSGLTHDDPAYSGIDPRAESFTLQNRAGHSSRLSRHHATNSLYRHYENTLPNLNEEELNDDVPGSLLVEDHHQNEGPQGYYEPFDPNREQDIDNLERGIAPPARGGSRTPDPTVWLGLVDPKERAMWKWANVENLDVFLQQVLLIGFIKLISKGLRVLPRKGHILHYTSTISEFSVFLIHVFVNEYRTIAFVVGFSTFLIACINWSKIRGSHTLSDIIIDNGLSKYRPIPSPC